MDYGGVKSEVSWTHNRCFNQEAVKQSIWYRFLKIVLHYLVREKLSSIIVEVTFNSTNSFPIID